MNKWQKWSSCKPLQAFTKNAIVLLKVGRLNQRLFLPYRFRVFIAESALQNPLELPGVNPLPPISVMIPCVEKDFPLLETCIEGAKRNVMNPIDKIVIVTDNPRLIQLSNSTGVEIVTEENFLPTSINEYIKTYIPSSVQGWVSKQLIVMYFAYTSREEGVLTIDADTILLNPRIFLNSSQQILCPVVEYELDDAVTTSSTWKAAGQSIGISFKSHHMLMRPTIVREMFDSIGGFENGSVAWLKTTLSNQWRPFSEFHSYATWIMNRYPREVKFARWANARVSRSKVEKVISQKSASEIYEYFKESYQNIYSISLHHYLSDEFEEFHLR